MDYNSVYNESLKYYNQLMVYNYMHYTNGQLPYAAMSNLSAAFQLTPPSQQILDEFLRRQYMPQVCNEPQLPVIHQGVRPCNSSVEGTLTAAIIAPTGMNRRSIFKQKCRRYVPSPQTNPSTEVQTSKSPLPEVVPPCHAELDSDKISQAAIIPHIKAKSNPQTPTVPINVFEPPISCLTSGLQGKEKRSAMVTSTPNTVSRRHIFKKKCNRYVPKALDEVAAEVNDGSRHVNVKKWEVDEGELTGTTPSSFKKKSHVEIQGLPTQNRQLIGSVPEKRNTPEFITGTERQSPQQMEESWTQKIEEVIKEVYDKISVGATTQTIAHLNDEFEKFIQTLQQKGYDVEDKHGSNQKATSPNTAIPDLPEPAKIKYPEEPVKMKREKQKMKKTHFDHLKPSHQPLQKRLNDEKVPIGMGYARVPARLLKNMNWNSYSNCTRKLMTAVFPRRILATHSLTGKASPAFPDKPAKKMLNPMLINDIIITVMDKCDVSESQVRVCVTTKCADESKMLRSHEQRKVKPRGNHKENCPPSSATDDDSVYGASD